jgi:hypothetical protein
LINVLPVSVVVINAERLQAIDGVIRVHQMYARDY